MNVEFIPRANESHTYAEAKSEKDFDECVEEGIVFDSSIILTLQNNHLGPRFFICTDGNHCNMGMKFTIHVLPKSVTMPNTAVKIHGLLPMPILFFITIMANLFFFFFLWDGAHQAKPTLFPVILVFVFKKLRSIVWLNLKIKII